MFEVDDRVYIPSNGATATVLEVDDDIVYVELDNGVEMDFRSGQLVSQEEREAEVDKLRPTPSKHSSDSYIPMLARQGLEEIWTVINGAAPDVVNMVKQFHISFAALLTQAPITAIIMDSAGLKTEPWETLSTHEKLKWIAAITGINLVTWCHACSIVPEQLPETIQKARTNSAKFILMCINANK